MLAIPQRVTGDAILENYGLIQNRRCAHGERLKETLLQKFGIALPADLLDDHSKQKVADIAVLPSFARREADWIFHRRCEHLRSRVVGSHPACVERAES